MNALQIAKLRVKGVAALLEGTEVTVGDILKAVEALTQAASGLTATAILALKEAQEEE
jgi:hypothetical protein